MLALQQILLVFSFLVSGVDAVIPCDSDADCQTRYESITTICLQESKTCSNPFQQGCLRTLEEMKSGSTKKKPRYKKRVCNSDDGDPSSIATLPATCNRSDFHDTYPEIRIHNANWESSVIIAWIYQIVLSELVQVPATVGLTSLDTPFASFYSETNDFVFSPEAYPYHALKQANKVGKDSLDQDRTREGNHRKKRGDCSATLDPCVDVLPEVWQGQVKDYYPLIERKIIEPPSGDGLLGRSGFYIPARTMQQFPQFSIWYGLSGEANRKLLAETFLRPLSWLEYCEQVSASKCQEASSIAARFPEPSEVDIYFQEDGLYVGYFTESGANNCTMYPTNCTGHIVTPPCGWSSPIDAQLYWNNIVGLSREGGPLTPVSGYTQSQMTQILRAANATSNNLIMHWYEPEPVHIEFHGTDYELISVTLPAPTSDCLKSRVDDAERCSASDEVRRGNSSLGGCGDDIELLQRLIASIVPEHTFTLAVVDQSPAYEFLKKIQIKNLDMITIIQNWKRRQVDPMGNDLRSAVCQWVFGNLNQLQGMIPNGYPRVLKSRSPVGYKSWYLLTAVIIGGVVAAIAVIGFLAVFRFRNTKAMVFTQPVFLQMILIGFFLISLGAVFYATNPEPRHCVSSMWLLMLGYTIELVPVLVKTAKINHLIQSYTKTQKRIQLNRRTMLLQVAMIVTVVLAYLTLWTVNDPPKPVQTRSLQAVQGSAMAQVEYDTKCSSDSSAWMFGAYAWQAILLILAAFLAFQSRDVMSQLNESMSLAVMVYSHFLFVCLRGVFSVFYVQETFPASVTACLLSLAYSLDALAAMAIYVCPKILASRNAPTPYKPGMLSSSAQRGESTNIENNDDEDEDCVDGSNDVDAPRLRLPKPISILVCSANMGNQEPTIESLEAWIPPGGSCAQIKPLDDDDGDNDDDDVVSKALHSFQTFGLIAIGMQEATWAATTSTKESKSKEITEEEVLNALEEANTIQLREMIQETLGDDYFQIADERRGQMRLHLWAKRQVAKSVIDVKISGANTGIGNVLANKGGIVATVQFRKTRITFVTAHLAAHEGDSYYKMRCDNIRSILREAKTFDLFNKFDVSTSSHHTFFLGDLNFRSRFADDKSHEEHVALAKELIESQDLPTLYALDELQQGLQKHDFLVGFNSLPCLFQPTFKVERQPGFAYKGQRVPSWTDRILFHSSANLEENLRALSYEACSDYINSDHKPIRGAFSLISNEDLGTIRVEGELIFDFHKIRCSNLPAVNTNGKSDPYVMILWDSIPFHSDVAALDFLRALWSGASWPKTGFIPKSLHPYWKGQSISLRLKNATVGSDGMIFVAVMNYDKIMGRHDLLGATVINVRELITTSMNLPPTEAAGELMEERSVAIARHLVRDGRYAGEIKLQVGVKRRRAAATQTQRRSSVFQHAFSGMNHNERFSAKLSYKEDGSDTFRTNPPVQSEDIRV